jgi:DNA-binding response OmpR family regulator
VGALTVDPGARLAWLHGRQLALTPKEFDLLALFASDAGAVLTRQRILESVWDTSWLGPTRTIDVHVAALRKKLGSPTWIETVRGVGFRLVPPG